MFSVDEDGWFKTKFSKFSTNLRIMAWIRRFCHNTRKPHSKRNDKFISIIELREAEVAIIKIIQQDFKYGPKEMKQINKCMAPTTIEDNGLIRLKTPIANLADTVSFRYPYLLPRKHPLVQALVWEIHKNYCHAGTQFVMAKLREKYWITQARKTVSSVIHQCMTCNRFVAKRMDTIPATLPVKRVKTGEIFDSTGVDLFGPVILKNNSKIWVVLYTCAVYRAIHLDIVNSISIKAFIESLTNWWSTREQTNHQLSMSEI